MQRQNESKPLLKDQYPNYSEPISSTKNEKEKEIEKEKGKEKDKDLVEAKASLDHLPPELIEHIIKFLRLKDLPILMRVNKKINEITKNTPAGDVLDLRERIIRALKEIESIEKLNETGSSASEEKMIAGPDGLEIENPDEERSFSFKNKQGRSFTTGEMLFSMQKCQEWSQQIPKLNESAHLAGDRASYIGEVVSRPLIPGASLLCGSSVGAGIGIGLNYGLWGGNFTNIASLVGLAAGGLLGGVGTVTTLVCVYASLSFFSNRKNEEANRLTNEINSDLANQLLAQIAKPKALGMAK